MEVGLPVVTYRDSIKKGFADSLSKRLSLPSHISEVKIWNTGLSNDSRKHESEEIQLIYCNFSEYIIKYFCQVMSEIIFHIKLLTKLSLIHLELFSKLEK